MDRYEEENYIKNHLADYLSATRPGINLRRPMICINPEHDDTKASMFYYTRGKHPYLKCQGCGACVSTYDVIGWDNNVESFADMARLGRQWFFNEDEKPRYTLPIRQMSKAKPKKDYMSMYERDRRSFFGSPAEKYINGRGISSETARRFWLGYERGFYFGIKSDALIIPCSRNSFTARNIKTEGDRLRSYGQKTDLFNVKALSQTDKPVFIVEGEIDALSIIEVGGDAIALRGATNNQNFISAVKGYKTKFPLILIPDNDDTGEKTTRERSEELKKNDIPHVVMRLNHKGIKDANELLQKDRELLTASIKEFTREVMS